MTLDNPERLLSTLFSLLYVSYGAYQQQKLVSSNI